MCDSQPHVLKNHGSELQANSHLCAYKFYNTPVRRRDFDLPMDHDGVLRSDARVCVCRVGKKVLVLL